MTSARACLILCLALGFSLLSADAASAKAKRAQIRTHDSASTQLQQQTPKFDPSDIDGYLDCVTLLEELSPDGKLAAVYEAQRLMLEDTVTFKDVLNHIMHKSTDTEKMAKTSFRLLTGITRVALKANPAFSTFLDSKQLKDTSAIFNSSDVAGSRALLDEITTFLSAHKSRVSCPMLDVVFINQKFRLQDHTNVNGMVRAAIGAGLRAVSLVISTAVAAAGSFSPMGPLAAGLAAGSTAVVGSLTERLTTAVLSKNDAIKAFRRALRINMIESMRPLLVVEGGASDPYKDDCYDSMMLLFKIMRVMFLEDKFEVSQKYGSSASSSSSSHFSSSSSHSSSKSHSSSSSLSPSSSSSSSSSSFKSRDEIVADLKKCADDPSWYEINRYERYNWMTEILSHVVLPIKYSHKDLKANAEGLDLKELMGGVAKGVNAGMKGYGGAETDKKISTIHEKITTRL